MPMKIAILGWGSLLWEGGVEFDRWHEQWHYNGPTLKIEFSRVSKTRLGALTLVIDEEHGSPTTVAWCLSKRQIPEDAICDLRCREGTTIKNIGRIFVASNVECCEGNNEKNAIVGWAKEKEIDVVVWTALKSNFKEKAKRPFSVEEVVSYVKTLNSEGKVKAAEYVWKAPNFVQTRVRTALQREPWFSSPGS
ncbi:hypothetical protein ACTRXD_02530 [Nitrospira sp. T9]|uniref:hypothetical protein n=1 Tax=unclassified Nitrospira TaxID=2652172 RepID=UPI003F96EE1F